VGGARVGPRQISPAGVALALIPPPRSLTFRALWRPGLFIETGFHDALEIEVAGRLEEVDPIESCNFSLCLLHGLAPKWVAESCG